VLDYAAGIDAAVQHLSDLGHSDIGFISGPMNLTSARVRRQAFIASLNRKGIRFDPEPDRGRGPSHGRRPRRDGPPARPPPPPHRDPRLERLTAIGAMGAIFERGLSVPEDISVIGFDDIDLSAFTQPPLTTIRVSREEVARIAFRALFNANQDVHPQGEEFTIQPTLVQRKSTGRMVPCGLAV
jgi:DNA-binding LacI/PurR family transcriptional regulator